MDWYDITDTANERTGDDGRLSSLPTEWERELAALGRLEADVNNGAYLQFLGNCGRESYEYASRALKKIGAHRMAAIVDACQALVDAHPPGTADRDFKFASLPEDVRQRIFDLSDEFMNYPDNIAELGLRYYQPFIVAWAGEGAG